MSSLCFVRSKPLSLFCSFLKIVSNSKFSLTTAELLRLNLAALGWLLRGSALGIVHKPHQEEDAGLS